MYMNFEKIYFADEPVTQITRANSVNVKLTKTLMNKRTKKTRPVLHPHDTLTVHVLAALYQIVDVVLEFMNIY